MSENIVGALDPRTRSTSGSERTVPSLLAHAVSAAPGAVALEQGGSSLTYAELDSLTSVVARWLVAEGVGPKSVVVLALERSAELAVAWWSVMKAGGCVVRVAPAEPSTRVDAIVRDCGAVLGLAMSADIASSTAQKSASDRFRWDALDELDLEDFSAEPVTDDDLSSPLRVDHPAFVDYPEADSGRVDNRDGTTGNVFTQADACDAAVPIRDGVIREILTAARTHSIFGSAEVAATEVEPTVEMAIVPAVKLSAAESRLWQLNRADPTSPAYNLSSALGLSGSLDVDRLESAVRAVARRHEPLRTIYPAGADGLESAGRSVLTAASVDAVLSRATVDDNDVTASMFAFAERGFDLTREVPFRASLISVGDNDSVLVVVMHRIAADDASLDIALRDIFTAYGAPERSVPVSFTDYQRRQHDRLVSGVGDTDRAFWMRTLRAVTVVDVPTDRPRPDTRSLDSGSVYRALSADTRTAVSDLAASRAVPISAVVHAAFAVVLSSLGGTRDVTVATDVAGREDDSVAVLVGPIANTVACRLDVDPSARAGDLVDAAARALADARAHSTLPFESLVQELDSDRTKAHPITRIALSFRDVASPPRGIAGLDITTVELDVEASEFDLHVVIADDAGRDGMRLGLVHSTSLFDRRTAKSMLDMLIVVLGAVASDPSTLVGDIEVGSLEVGRHRSRGR